MHQRRTFCFSNLLVFAFVSYLIIIFKFKKYGKCSLWYQSASISTDSFAGSFIIFGVTVTGPTTSLSWYENSDYVWIRQECLTLLLSSWLHYADLAHFNSSSYVCMWCTKGTLNNHFLLPPAVGVAASAHSAAHWSVTHAPARKENVTQKPSALHSSNLEIQKTRIQGQQSEIPPTCSFKNCSAHVQNCFMLFFYDTVVPSARPNFIACKIKRKEKKKLALPYHLNENVIAVAAELDVASLNSAVQCPAAVCWYQTQEERARLASLPYPECCC